MMGIVSAVLRLRQLRLREYVAVTSCAMMGISRELRQLLGA